MQRSHLRLTPTRNIPVTCRFVLLVPVQWLFWFHFSHLSEENVSLSPYLLRDNLVALCSSTLVNRRLNNPVEIFPHSRAKWWNNFFSYHIWLLYTRHFRFIFDNRPLFLTVNKLCSFNVRSSRQTWKKGFSQTLFIFNAKQSVMFTIRGNLSLVSVIKSLVNRNLWSNEIKGTTLSRQQTNPENFSSPNFDWDVK